MKSRLLKVKCATNWWRAGHAVEVTAVAIVHGKDMRNNTARAPACFAEGGVLMIAKQCRRRRPPNYRPAHGQVQGTADGYCLRLTRSSGRN